MPRGYWKKLTSNISFLVGHIPWVSSELAQRSTCRSQETSRVALPGDCIRAQVVQVVHRTISYPPLRVGE